jgi:hypothetical protein
LYGICQQAQSVQAGEFYKTRLCFLPGLGMEKLHVLRNKKPLAEAN